MVVSTGVIGIGIKIVAGVLAGLGIGSFIVKNTDEIVTAFDIVKNSVAGIYTFFQSIIGLITSFVSIIPNPYASVISTFLVINFGIILWKLVRS